MKTTKNFLTRKLISILIIYFGAAACFAVKPDQHKLVSRQAELMKIVLDSNSICVFRKTRNLSDPATNGARFIAFLPCHQVSLNKLFKEIPEEVSNLQIEYAAKIALDWINACGSSCVSDIKKRAICAPRGNPWDAYFILSRRAYMVFSVDCAASQTDHLNVQVDLDSGELTTSISNVL